MGHDVTAMNPTVNAELLREELRLDQRDDSWEERYDEFTKATEISSVRRAAWNPLNGVIYLALGVMDEAYAGCSGNGSLLKITKPQFLNARDILEKKSYVGMSRERNQSDELVDCFRGMGAKITSPQYTDPDITQEKQFVGACIRFMDDNKLDNIDVYFF